MARWKLCSSTPFEILPLSTCALCRQKSYISIGIQPIFDIFASARRLWGWGFGWKVSGAQIFYFCNGKVITLRIDNIWNLPLSTCTLRQKKSYISKGIQPIFEIFASARRLWGWAFRWKASGAQIFYFCNGKARTLRVDNIWNFATFNLYNVPAKNPISPKRIHPIFEIIASARRCWGWTFGWKVSGAQVFYFCNGNVKTLSIEIIGNFATFNLDTVPSKILYLQRYSTDFRNLCLRSKRLRVDIWMESFRCAVILLLQWQGESFAHPQHLKFLPLWTSTRCQQKTNISKGIQPIFEIFASAPRCWTCAFGWKVLGAQVLYFCNAKVNILRIDNNWNFATFNLYPVQAKILYLQRYSTHFRNLYLSSKILSMGIWVEGFRCAGILLLQWQGEKFCASTTFEILPLSICTLCQQKSQISKGIQPIFEIFASARRFWGWAFGRKHSLAQLFYFCNGKLKNFRIDNNWNFATFNLYTVQAKILYLQRYPTHFRNLYLSSKMLRVGIWVESLRRAGILLLQWQDENFAHGQQLKFWPLSTCTLCQQKSYISKCIQPIFEIFASAWRCWGWAFGWKVLGAQIFNFCNGKV